MTKKEYDKLVYLDSIWEYYIKRIESNACSIDINELNQLEISIYEDNPEKENIEKDVEYYNQTRKEYDEHLKFLIKKYNIKPSGNISKKIAFTFRDDIEQVNQKNFKVITAILDYKFYF